MKKIVRLALVFMIILSMLFISSCEVPIDTDSTLYKNAEAMIEALSEDDSATARALFGEACTDEDFNAAYPQLAEFFRGIGEYDVSGLGFYRGITNGISYSNMTLLISAEKGDFQLFVEERSDFPGVLSTFYVSEYENVVDLTPSGPVNVIQIVLLLISALELAFVIWMTVDCAKRKIRKKALWIVIILLANVVFKLALTAGNISFNVAFLFGISSFSVPSAGGFAISISIPIGAIIWLIMRDRIKPIENPSNESQIPYVSASAGASVEPSADTKATEASREAADPHENPEE